MARLYFWCNEKFFHSILPRNIVIDAFGNKWDCPLRTFRVVVSGGPSGFA